MDTQEILETELRLLQDQLGDMGSTEGKAFRRKWGK